MECAEKNTVDFPVGTGIDQAVGTKRTAALLIGSAASILLHLAVFALLFCFSHHTVKLLSEPDIIFMQVNLPPSLVSFKPHISLRPPTKNAPGGHAPDRVKNLTEESHAVRAKTDGSDVQVPVTEQKAMTVTTTMSDPSFVDHQISDAPVTTNDSDFTHLPGEGRNQEPDINRAGNAISAIPRYLYTPRPTYPEVSRIKGQEGLVIISAWVGVNGTVSKAEVRKTSGFVRLDQSALTAIRSWRFEPARTDNIVHAVTVDIPIRFSLKK